MWRGWTFDEAWAMGRFLLGVGFDHVEIVRRESAHGCGVVAARRGERARFYGRPTDVLADMPHLLGGKVAAN